MGLRRIIAIFTCLLFVDENPLVEYADAWIAPFGWLHDFFYFKPPHQLRPFDHILILCMFLAKSRAESKGPRVAPMRSALLLSVATIVVWFVYGIARGGNVRFGCWQIYVPLSGVLFAFTITSLFRTPEHYAMLARWLLIAAFYRAMMCVLFYWFVVRTGRVGLPDYMTSHDDSVLWVVAMVILLLRILRSPKVGERIGAFLFFVLIAAAVQFNSRRLAWVSLVMGLVVFFILLPPGKAKRRAVRTVMVVAPVLGLYVALGWGSSERFFKPVQAFTSITTVEDESTKSRNYENLGLLSTAQNSGWIIGGGWGHEYTPLSMQYDLTKAFELWRYVPHNSILGIFAFTGALGFTGYWIAFPTAMFLNARVARMGKSQAARDVGLIAAVQMVVCVNQYFGDMGFFSVKVVYMMSASFAIALRMPITSGVWSAAGATAPRKLRSQPQPARPEAPAVEDAWQS